MRGRKGIKSPIDALFENKVAAPLVQQRFEEGGVSPVIPRRPGLQELRVLH